MQLRSLSSALAQSISLGQLKEQDLQDVHNHIVSEAVFKRLSNPLSRESVMNL